MTIVDTTKFIAACDISNGVPLIKGLHGTGKSDSIRAYSAANNMHCEVLILSLMDVSDLMGIPRTTNVGGATATIWAAPSWYQNIVNAALPATIAVDDLQFSDKAMEKAIKTSIGSVSSVDRAVLNSAYCSYMGISDDTLHIINQDAIQYTKAKRSVLFLDEFNRAPSDVLNASLQLVLDKRLHTHILPRVGGKPTFVIAAINPADANYTVNEFDPALLDRFVEGEVEADAKSWLEWARSNHVNDVVQSFIAEHPDRIHFTPADGSVGATPRSWTQLSRFVDNFANIPHEVQFQTMKGCIGVQLASQFLTHYNNFSKAVKLEDLEAIVAKQRKKTNNPDEISKPIAKLIKNQEVIQKSEMAEKFYTKYIDEEGEDLLPLISYLYALDLEILASFLKEKKDSDSAGYMKVIAVDGTLNNKELVRRIVSKAKTK